MGRPEDWVKLITALELRVEHAKKGTKFKDIDKNQNKQQLIMGFISMQTETDQTPEMRGEKTLRAYHNFAKKIFHQN